jgi:hypothetical protein
LTFGGAGLTVVAFGSTGFLFVDYPSHLALQVFTVQKVHQLIADRLELIATVVPVAPLALLDFTVAVLNHLQGTLFRKGLDSKDFFNYTASGEYIGAHHLPDIIRSTILAHVFAGTPESVAGTGTGFCVWIDLIFFAIGAFDSD